MPIIQIDWQEIKTKLDDVTAIYALTHRQASFLLSLTEQLLWSKTWRVESYDPDDKDQLDWEIADTQNNLMSPVNLTDIIGYIDEIESLLRGLEFIGGCCGESDVSDGDFYTDGVTDGVGAVPDAIVDAGYADDDTDWDGFDDYKCVISHVFVDSLEAKLRTLAPYVDATGAVIGGLATIISIITTIFSGGLTAIAAGIIGSTGAAALLYKLITSGSILESVADDVAENHDELACAVYDSDGVDGSIAALEDKLDELFDPVTATLLKFFNHKPELKALYGGRYDQQSIAQALVDAGYDPESFSCDCEPAPTQLIPNPEFDGIDGWTITGTLPNTWEYISSYVKYANTSDTGGSGSEKIKSSNFTVPAGVTQVWTGATMFTSSQRAFDCYYHLYRASDNAFIGGKHTAFSVDATPSWTTLYQNPATPLTVVPGEEYYIKIRVMTFTGVWDSLVSAIWLFTYDPTA